MDDEIETQKEKKQKDIELNKNLNITSSGSTKTNFHVKSFSESEEKGHNTDNLHIFDYYSLLRTTNGKISKTQKFQITPINKITKIKPWMESTETNRTSVHLQNKTKIPSMKSPLISNSVNLNSTYYKSTTPMREKNLKTTKSKFLEKDTNKPKQSEGPVYHAFPGIKPNQQKIVNPQHKTIYNFQMNIKRLTHHWNQNNPHVKSFTSAVKQSEVLKMIRNKHSTPTNVNYTTVDDIYNLFAIENKNELLKGIIY